MCHTLSQLVYPNKKVDFEVDFDDEKIRQTTAEQSIANKDDSIKTLIAKVTKV